MAARAVLGFVKRLRLNLEVLNKYPPQDWDKYLHMCDWEEQSFVYYHTGDRRKKGARSSTNKAWFQKGTAHPKTSMTSERLTQIWKLASEGMRGKEISQIEGMPHTSTINKILHDIFTA